MLGFKKSKTKLRKIKLQDLELIIKECDGTRSVKGRYWWCGMRRAIAKYVALCNNCQ
jgi:hypothetical protein